MEDQFIDPHDQASSEQEAEKTSEGSGLSLNGQNPEGIQLQTKSPAFSGGIQPWQLVGLAGCILVLVGMPMTFAPFPVDGRETWLAGGAGAGIPIAFLTFACAFLVLFKRVFLVISVAVFSSFFLVLEILIAYDIRAIANGTAGIPDAPLRTIWQILNDAFRYNYGAYWIALGLTLVFIAAVHEALMHHIRETAELEKTILISQVESTERE